MPEPDSGDSLHADLLLDSVLPSVDRGEAVAMEAARLLGFDADTQQDIGIAVRESLVNAVAHGNRYNARKKVKFRVWRGPRGLVIEVEDQGRGFSPDGVPDPLEGDNMLRHSGRGLLMIRAYMDEVDYSPVEPEGTRVRMVKYAPKPAGG
jgi:serine/threonine-protein kinase RsbW